MNSEPRTEIRELLDRVRGRWRALVALRAAVRGALVIASDLDNRWNDFPLHATFVPFVHEAVRYLAGARAHAVDYLIGDAPAGVKRAPGIVTVAGSARSAGATHAIAINVDPRETDPARLSADEFQSAVARLKETGGVDTRGEAREQEDRQQLWRYALAAMALLLAAYTQHGGGIFIAAGPEVDGDVVGDVLGAGSTLRIARIEGAKPAPRVLAPADGRHPVFQAFAGNPASLGLVTFQTVTRIGGAGCQTLARFTTGDTALIECPAGDGRAIVLASDLDNRWNDFPLHATFVPFVHEVAHYLASARGHAVDYLIADAPAGVTRAPGIATLDGGARRIAINVDPRESDPARLSVDDFQSAVTRLKDAGGSETRGEARQQEDEQHLWRYALAAVAILLAAEGVLAARTA